MVVKWEDGAKESLRNVYDYYLAVAGQRVATERISKILREVDRLNTGPYVASVEQSLEDEEDEVRSLVIMGRYKAIYYIEKETIVIVDLWDCRQSPLTLVKRIFGKQ